MRTKFRSLLLRVVAVLALTASAALVLPGISRAVEKGVYKATATPYYEHPVTGEIDDPGKNPGIGQGMSESVLHDTAILEVDSNGQMYATVRFSLMDSLSSVKFYTENENGSYNDLTYTITKEDGDTADFLFAVPKEDCILKSSFYVGPMGRDVEFFFQFSALTPLTEETEGFLQTVSLDAAPATQNLNQPRQEEEKSNHIALIIGIAVAACVIAVSAAVFTTCKRGKRS